MRKTRQTSGERIVKDIKRKTRKRYSAEEKIRISKQILRQLPGLDSGSAARLESEYQNKCANSEDAAAAIMAFISKTKATFKGR